MRTLHMSFLILFALSTGNLRAAPNENSALGINIGGVTYWSSEIVFVDLFKHSQTFKSQAPGKGYAQGGPLDLTADGWVRSKAWPSAVRNRPRQDKRSRCRKTCSMVY